MFGRCPDLAYITLHSLELPPCGGRTYFSKLVPPEHLSGERGVERPGAGIVDIKLAENQRQDDAYKQMLPRF